MGAKVSAGDFAFSQAFDLSAMLDRNAATLDPCRNSRLPDSAGVSNHLLSADGGNHVRNGFHARDYITFVIGMSTPT